MDLSSHRLAAWSRGLAALCLLGAGLVHLEEFLVQHYAQIPTIGTLFVLDVAAAAPIACGLLAPTHRLLGRAGPAAAAMLVASAIAVAAGSLAGLFVSEHGGLFGFAETGHRPAVVLAVVLEAMTIALLGVHLAAARSEEQVA